MNYVCIYITLYVCVGAQLHVHAEKGKSLVQISYICGRKKKKMLNHVCFYIFFFFIFISLQSFDVGAIYACGVGFTSEAEGC